MDAILKKMAAILNLNFFTDDVKKKMVPNFFEISTPKLTKLADKIHFGTKIQLEYTVNLTIMRVCMCGFFSRTIVNSDSIKQNKLETVFQYFINIDYFCVYIS
jgi:hypothetical protein